MTVWRLTSGCMRAARTSSWRSWQHFWGKLTTHKDLSKQDRAQPKSQHNNFNKVITISKEVKKETKHANVKQEAQVAMSTEDKNWVTAGVNNAKLELNANSCLCWQKCGSNCSESCSSLVRPLLETTNWENPCWRRAQEGYRASPMWKGWGHWTSLCGEKIT